MSSVDGRLINYRWTKPFDGKSMSELFAVYGSCAQTLNTDAWMFGLNTVQEGFLTQTFRSKVHTLINDFTPYVAPNRTERMFIVTDPNGEIFYDNNTVRGCRIITILGMNVSAEYLQHLRKSEVSYVFGGDDGTDLASALNTIGDNFGIKRISLQGGGIINGAFLEGGLIDELSLVMYPGIDGLHGIPSIFEYIGSKQNPANGQSLELYDVRKLEHGVLWLRYKFHKTL
jgi:5-amino-6-(5-phosphoribosylamino)uracil reductase